MAKPKGKTGGMPRGLRQEGSVLFSYGFRPFFLGAAVWAALAMALWIAALSGQIDVAGGYGAARWHVHEMLFGFAPAVLAGFLLTSVPNWTGQLPVAGPPLMALFVLWLAGRLALLASGLTGPLVAVVIESLFLPAMLYIFGREIISGRKWKDLKLVGVLAVLTLANLAFHAETPTGIWAGGGVFPTTRAALAAYLALIMIVGGRLVPSFTRNWLNQRGEARLPAPYDRLDRACLGLGALVLLGWTVAPNHPAIAVPALICAGLHAARLARWRRHRVAGEPLLLALHLAYAFIPLGLAAVALGAWGFLPDNSVTHVMAVGALAGMMMAVMMRSTRGHAGRILAGSRLTLAASGLLSLAALLRPAADLFADQSGILIGLAGLAWIAAWTAFLLEHGPMLLKARRRPLN